MSAKEDEWGDMIMPGVYMISRSNKTISSSLQLSSNTDGVSDFEYLHNDIEKMQFDITQLVDSNKEIQSYLNNIGSDKDISSYSEDEPKFTCHEDDINIFINALKENDLIIKRKQRELIHLKEILNGLRCGCAHHDSSMQQRSHSAESVTPNDRITL
ncbi:unnamed protein product [Phytomonas sp. Hart1]|nr:unnamed protein product [Phytomonas sp. Hart1]|eukprot:CCW70455.1 unnamed protein product [Phytomonas sp. isolate Hart1]